MYRPINYALKLIKHFSDCCLYPYQVPSGKWFIGYHSSSLNDLSPITKNTPQISQEIADILLIRDLEIIRKDIKRLVTKPLTDYQEGAILSLIYAEGLKIFETSLIPCFLNTDNNIKAAHEFLNYPHHQKECPSLSLMHRRRAERAMFMGKNSP